MFADNSGSWGRGGIFSALDKLSPFVGQRYEKAYEMKGEKLYCNAPSTLSYCSVSPYRSAPGRRTPREHLQQRLSRVDVIALRHLRGARRGSESKSRRSLVRDTPQPLDGRTQETGACLQEACRCDLFQSKCTWECGCTSY